MLVISGGHRNLLHTVHNCSHANEAQENTVLPLVPIPSNPTQSTTIQCCESCAHVTCDFTSGRSSVRNRTNLVRRSLAVLSHLSRATAGCSHDSVSHRRKLGQPWRQSIFAVAVAATGGASTSIHPVIDADCLGPGRRSMLETLEG